MWKEYYSNSVSRNSASYGSSRYCSEVWGSKGGTFTISNLGAPFGAEQLSAIISPSQAGILAVGTAERRVVPGAGPDQFDVASFMPVLIFKANCCAAS
ncbi:dihydrolipoyllysine-residue acetyltransferase component 3 of pyruvate dehydrogenase complex, mitochondrial-like [Papaver somniferum]|uniref:dihydrolipoyllysine-residue acetyltransferase component 3 of pyruvate dehydrogenase complex, mitochondrial-like n=1 Tax=Papaver somniferum TaxID=3469 RepID=UPI000E6FDCA1|nr:dihydrolipoyllysine-residue acetyltransferase component 3 of pyruvate dehydrogenase complex, mitochondrial-like [Papaver somniferum]